MDEHHYLIRGGIEGRERLRVLGRVMRPATLALLERAGVVDGHAVPRRRLRRRRRDVRPRLARRDHRLGGRASTSTRRRSSWPAATPSRRRSSNVEFQVADLTDGLGEDEYDVVYARFVLTHLADPEAGLAAMVAAPCGPAAVWSSRTSTTTASFCHPASDASRRSNEIYTQAALRNGGDPYIGGACRLMLVEAGVERVTASIAQPVGLEGEVKLLPPLTVENIKAMAVKHGVATRRGGRRSGRRALRASPATPRRAWSHPTHRAGLGEKRMTDQHYYMIRGGIEGRERLRVLSGRGGVSHRLCRANGGYLTARPGSPYERWVSHRLCRANGGYLTAGSLHRSAASSHSDSTSSRWPPRPVELGRQLGEPLVVLAGLDDGGVQGGLLLGQPLELLVQAREDLAGRAFLGAARPGLRSRDGGAAGSRAAVAAVGTAAAASSAARRRR